MATGNDLRPLLRPWLASLAQRSACTARNYRVACEQFLGSVGDGELDPDAIGDYLDSLRGLAPGSRAAKISAVRSFLKVCQSNGLIARSPRELLTRPRVTVTSYGRYLDLDELRRLLASARQLGPLHEALVTVMWSTGARVGEIAAAQWRDLFADPEGNVGWRIVGKGGRERVVKITPETLRLLAAVHGSGRLAAGDPSPLFPSPAGGAYSSWSLWAKLREAVAEARIEKPVSCHWMRHSCLTWAAHGGASAFQIQWQAGHAKLETASRYVHAATGLRDTAADKLPSLD
jgi:integrase/recombinase XerD